MGTTYHNKPIVTDGLVFYVDAANKESYPGSGTTATDIISNTSTTLQSSGMFENTNAGVFSFDGGTNYIDSGITLDGFSNFTLLSWANIPALGNGNYGTVTGVYDFVNIGGQSRARFFQRIEKSGANYVHFVGFGTEQISAAANPTIISNFSANTWVNLAVTYDGTNIKMYSNGDLDGTINAGSIGNLPPQGNFDGKLYIGATNRLNSDNVTHTIGNTLIGKVGPIQIYNRKLEASEVAQNYNALKNRFI